MTPTISRTPRKALPALESLEGRQLLNASARTSGHAPEPTRALDPHAAGVSLQDRRLSYTTPNGTHVAITLYGVGSLAGSSVAADGSLDLVFGQTNASTGIVAQVRGGHGHPLLRSIQNANVAPGDLSGIGGTALNVVNLKNFDLVQGGRINLTSGVHLLSLDTIGPDTQIHLREVPPTLSATSGGGMSGTVDGQTLQYSVNPQGALTLTGVSGQFTPTVLVASNPPFPNGVANHATPPAPPGIVVTTQHIVGAPQAADVVTHPQIFGLDPTANTLVRFDASTGAVLQTIPLTGMGGASVAVALGRDNGRLVALVAGGTTVRAFDALSGNPVGQFTTTNLAPRGLRSVNEIGSTDTRTVLADSSSGANGTAQIIDVTASLASGQAVPVGPAFVPARQFALSGGLPGLPASSLVYATGAAHFDTFQPDRTQYGVVTLNTRGGQLSEVARTPFLNRGAYQNVGPSGTAPGNPTQALGSFDQSLALATGVANGQNVVTLYNPQSLAAQGTIVLNDPNPLADLSETFRPGLAGGALVDVQGDLQSLRAGDAQGLTLNVAGFANLVKVGIMTNSVIVGEAFGHAEIPHRTNVTILSTPRPVGDRNGVTIVPGLRQVGPLSLPTHS